MKKRGVSLKFLASWRKKGGEGNLKGKKFGHGRTEDRFSQTVKEKNTEKKKDQEFLQPALVLVRCGKHKGRGKESRRR